jgi:glucan endo-1,3-alpha-glucosidase
LKTSADFADKGKNWLFVGDDLFYTRLESILETKPALLEMVTWNDYGESHYIGPVNRKYKKDDDGSGVYADVSMTHDSFRSMAALYIDAWKKGLSKVSPKKDQIVSLLSLVWVLGFVSA